MGEFWRPKGKPGEICGERRLVRLATEEERLARGLKTKSKVWLWQCSCGRTGFNGYTNIKNSRECPNCSARRTGLRRTWKPGKTVGVWEIVRYEKEQRYLARCMRCGYVMIRNINNFSPQSRSCGRCRYAVEIEGKWMTHKEIEQVFGLTPRELSKAKARGLSIADAIATPTKRR